MASHIKQFRLREPGRGSDAAGVKWIFVAIMTLMICLASASCNSASDDPPSESYPVSIDVDWSGYGKDSPSGMTIMFQHSATGEMVRVIDNNTDHTTAMLAAGRHRAMVFNLTPDEFESIEFRGLEDIATAKAFARKFTGSQWHTLPLADNSYVACQPQRLATDTILTSAVGPTAESRSIGTLHPRSIIRRLHITVATGNPGALIAARGAISGLASGRSLASDIPEATTVIHLIDSDSWLRSADASVNASVNCFGLPPNHRGLPDENILEFQALLADGKTVKTYTIPVGHLIKDAADQGNSLDMTLELTLDPALPSTGSAGDIDVWIKDWDGSIDLDLPL